MVLHIDKAFEYTVALIERLHTSLEKNRIKKTGFQLRFKLQEFSEFKLEYSHLSLNVNLN